MYNVGVRRDPEEGFPSDVPTLRDLQEYQSWLDSLIDDDYDDEGDDMVGVDDPYLSSVAAGRYI